MEGIDLSPGAVRRVMETAFEPHANGWVYYRSSWSGGVPVSAEERELFVANPTPENHRAFHARIKGRLAVTPARGVLKPLGTILRALPTGVLPAIVSGLFAALSLAWDDATGWVRVMLWVLAGVFALVAGILFFFRRGKP